MSFRVKKAHLDENGLLHREGGPARTWADGYVEYWFHGKHHREGGPAIIHTDGTKEYWVHGKVHREDGPAWENDPDGPDQYYIHGTQVEPFHSKEEYNLRLLGLIDL